MLLMLKSKMRLEFGGDALFEARGDLGEGEGVGDLEAKLRLELWGDNIEVRNEGERGPHLGLTRELSISISISGNII